MKLEDDMYFQDLWTDFSILTIKLRICTIRCKMILVIELATC